MWAPKLLWAEAIIRCDGKLMMVRWKVCNEIKGQEKIVGAKIRQFAKTCRKAKVQNSMSQMC